MQATAIAYVEFDLHRLEKIISHTSRGDSSDEERKEVFYGLKLWEKKVENERNAWQYENLSRHCIDIVFKYWRAENIKKSGIGASIERIWKEKEKYIWLTEYSR